MPHSAVCCLLSAVCCLLSAASCLLPPASCLLLPPPASCLLHLPGLTVRINRSPPLARLAVHRGFCTPSLPPDLEAARVQAMLKIRLQCPALGFPRFSSIWSKPDLIGWVPSRGYDLLPTSPKGTTSLVLATAN
ncbi:hypothetical protein BO71DRAFT_66612 [Aspergillus ellipticus CBS 707.79]|uniref:Ig-like domain-containing protein n=1 Tax=Aspergillus ellipticus CBS 707.79 TaxID=1448320 RepID=A0A319CZR7_9EURO|nr:hypothetical protein BO71DRAFT_66612 [Aspergillus ellipticus CBS 707.79]